MTLPRQVLPGQTYLITRSCTQQQFLLRPSLETNQNVSYCLALAASRTGILLHAVCFMSNHWHGVVTDPEARLPEFLERFHQLLAKVQNVSLGRRENFWSSDKTSAVLLVSESDVLRKIAYTLANPTASGLVRSPEEWPGLISLRFSGIDVEMPDVFFDEYSELDDEVRLEFVRPSIFQQLSDDELSLAIRSQVNSLVQCTRREMEQRGRSFLGRKAVLRESPSTIPKQPRHASELSPNIAAKSKTLRARALQRLVAFRDSYRTAWLRRRDGEREVVFPAGTYALRIYGGVACATPP